LPFNLPSHTTLPPGYFERFKLIDEDYDLSGPPLTALPQIDVQYEQRPRVPVKVLMKMIEGSSSQNPIDLTQDYNIQDYAFELLNATPMRYVHFDEDVRPPYWGTWTKPVTPEELKRVARSPFSQLDLFDYEYDSEAEWEEPGEGEDLEDDDGEEDDDEEEDMDDLLDDGDPNGGTYPKIGRLNEDQTPICSGLQWEDQHGILRPAGDAQRAEFSEFRIEFLLGLANSNDIK
jgi:chromatin assembly factor 1 subunit A